MGNDFEANRVLGVRVELVLVDDLPEAGSVSISRGLALNGIFQDGGLGEETISVQVVRVTNRFLDGLHVNLSNGVLYAVNHGVNAHGEEVLVVLSIDLGCNHGTESTRGFILCKNVSIDFTSSLDFIVDSTILVQVPVASIIVVGDSDNVRNHKTTSTNSVSTAISVLSVLVE